MVHGYEISALDGPHDGRAKDQLDPPRALEKLLAERPGRRQSPEKSYPEARRPLVIRSPRAPRHAHPASRDGMAGVYGCGVPSVWRRASKREPPEGKKCPWWGRVSLGGGARRSPAQVCSKFGNRECGTGGSHRWSGSSLSPSLRPTDTGTDRVGGLIPREQATLDRVSRFTPLLRLAIAS